jgi:hypothetical protein
MRAKREWHKDFMIKCFITNKRSEICWLLFFLTQNNDSFPFSCSHLWFPHSFSTPKAFLHSPLSSLVQHNMLAPFLPCPKQESFPYHVLTYDSHTLFLFLSFLLILLFLFFCLEAQWHTWPDNPLTPPSQAHWQRADRSFTYTPRTQSVFIHSSIRSGGRLCGLQVGDWSGRRILTRQKTGWRFWPPATGATNSSFCSEATCRGSNAVARNWLPSNYATLHLVHGVDFLCFRLFHGTLAQSQRKLPGPVRARVASSSQLLLLLGSFSAMLWDFVLFLQYRTKKLHTISQVLGSYFNCNKLGHT